jgi:hypothetical protein
MTQFELRMMDVLEICIENAERVNFCDVVSAYLVCSDKQLHLHGMSGPILANIMCWCAHLEMVIELSTTRCVERRCTVCWSREELGRGLESVGTQSFL